MSGGLQPVLQAAVSNGLSLDPFSFGHDGWAASEVDVGRAGHTRPNNSPRYVTTNLESSKRRSSSHRRFAHISSANRTMVQTDIYRSHRPAFRPILKKSGPG